MAEDKSYVTVWENVKRYDEELKDAFNKKADIDDHMSMANVLDVLNDISVILALDCEEAKHFYSQENKEIAEAYNLNALTYDHFIEILGIWLEHKAKSEGKALPNIRPGQNKVVASSTPKVLKPEPTNPNYEQSRKLMDGLLEKHKEGYHTLFKDRMLQEKQTEIAIQDYFMYLQDCFELEEVELKFKSDDKDDFFRTNNSYKKLYRLVEKYCKEAEINSGNPSGSIKLSYDECFQILDYFLRTDDNILLVDKRDTTKVGAAKRILLVTIANYERLINDTTNEIEKQVLLATVESLKEKLRDLEQGLINKDLPKQPVQPAGPSPLELQKREEKKQRALREIFYFYCTQQYNIGRAATFEKMDRLVNTITIGTFKVFLKNFRLKIDNRKLMELYHKAYGHDENMDFDGFNDLLIKVALRADLGAESKPHQPKPEIMKDYKPTSYKDDSSYKVFKQNEPKRIEELVNSRKGKTDYGDELKRTNGELEEIWEHMGIYNDAYKNLTGWIQLPFNTQEKKDFRMPLEFNNYKPKGIEGKPIQEVQEDIQKRNDQRKFVKDLQNLEHKLLSHYRESISPARQIPPGVVREDSYMSLQSNKSKLSIPRPKKLTMKKVEKYQQGEFVRLEDKFNPHDLIDDNDDEDNLYLAEYKLHSEKKERKTPAEVLQKRLEDYGSIKRPTRGFAVNGKYGSGSPSRNELKHYVSDTEIGSDYSRSRHLATNPASISPMKRSHASPKPGRDSPLMSVPTYLDYDGSLSSHSRSVKHHNGTNQSSPKHAYGYNDSSYTKGSKQSYNSTLDRASQIELNNRKREQQVLNSIMSIQDSQVRRGLKAVGK